jgi:hypothetical protein
MEASRGFELAFLEFIIEGCGFAALSSRGLGRGPLKAQTRVRIPLALLMLRVVFCEVQSAPSSIGQDGTLSRCREGFDSPWGYITAAESSLLLAVRIFCGKFVLFKSSWFADVSN